MVYGNSGRRGQLSVSEQTMTQDLLMIDTPVHRVRDYVLLKFGKRIKTAAIRHLQQKWRNRYLGMFDGDRASFFRYPGGCLPDDTWSRPRHTLT